MTKKTAFFGTVCDRSHKITQSSLFFETFDQVANKIN